VVGGLSFLPELQELHCVASADTLLVFSARSMSYVRCCSRWDMFV